MKRPTRRISPVVSMTVMFLLVIMTLWWVYQPQDVASFSSSLKDIKVAPSSPKITTVYVSSQKQTMENTSTEIKTAESDVRSTQSTPTILMNTAEDNVRRFYDTAKSHTPVTDKVTDHSYHTMYGRFLLPYYNTRKNMRMLEIGLGCDMNYGPGASAKLWKKLLPEAELWEAEVNGRCVEKANANGQLEGIQTLVGDQSKPEVLDRWVQETGGGKFDVIIDDGGHRNVEIKRTFEKFWPLLNFGGLYFIEDMQVGKKPRNMMNADGVMSDVIQDWIEQLTYSGAKFEFQRRNTMYKLPEHVAFITCQRHACLIGKLTEMEREARTGDQ